MLVADNVTRWNRTIRALHRALKLESRIIAFCKDHADELEEDTLTDEEWKEQHRINEILLPYLLFGRRQAVGLVGILVSWSRELKIAVGTVFGLDNQLSRLLKTLSLEE